MMIMEVDRVLSVLLVLLPSLLLTCRSFFSDATFVSLVSIISSNTEDRDSFSAFEVEVRSCPPDPDVFCPLLLLSNKLEALAPEAPVVLAAEVLAAPVLAGVVCAVWVGKV